MRELIEDMEAGACMFLCVLVLTKAAARLDYQHILFEVQRVSLQEASAKLQQQVEYLTSEAAEAIKRHLFRKVEAQ